MGHTEQTGREYYAIEPFRFSSPSNVIAQHFQASLLWHRLLELDSDEVLDVNTVENCLQSARTKDLRQEFEKDQLEMANIEPIEVMGMIYGENPTYRGQQEKLIRSIFSRAEQSLVAIMATSEGKSLAFFAPALLFCNKLTLVITPMRALIENHG